MLTLADAFLLAASGLSGFKIYYSLLLSINTEAAL